MSLRDMLNPEDIAAARERYATTKRQAGIYMLGTEEIDHRFGFHKGTIEGPNATVPEHTQMRLQFKAFATFLDVNLPVGRAKSVALTELESASMWSHKAIAAQAHTVAEG